MNVPSFGEWGFVLAGRDAVASTPLRPMHGRYYDSEHEASMFYFPPDFCARHDVAVNTLIRPVIVDYFRKDWKMWN